MGCCSSKHEALNDALIKLHDTSQEVLTDSDNLLYANPCAANIQLTSALGRHQVDINTYEHVLRQMLFILTHHKCSVVCKCISNGKSISVSDHNSIRHSLCIESIGTKCFIPNARNRAVDTDIWLRRKTHIYLKAEVKKTALESLAFPTNEILHRHVVNMPLAEIILQSYNLVVPIHVEQLLWRFVCPNIDSLENEVNHVYYPNFFDESIDTGDINNNTDEKKEWEIGGKYINSDNGEVGFTIETSQKQGKLQLFESYYGKIIRSFNMDINHFVENNKFYNITTKNNTQIEPDEIEIDFKIYYSSGRYHFRCFLLGFNNLNMSEAVNTVATNKCLLKSNEFDLKWTWKRCNDAYYKGDLVPGSASFEKCCNFLASTDNHLTIESQKFYQFLKGQNDQTGLEIYEGLNNSNDLFTNHSAVSSRLTILKWKFASYNDTHEDEIDV